MPAFSQRSSIRGPSQRGQVVVLYILLLLISVGLGYVMLDQLIGTPGRPGFFLERWEKIIRVIEQDQSDAPST